MSYDDTNKGAIWKNEKKLTDNHPDFTGSINVDGKEYWVSAWKRGDDAKPSAPALKFSISEKGQKQQSTQQSAPQQNNSGYDDFDDDIPF